MVQLNAPFNGLTGKTYRGPNRTALAVVVRTRGYKSLGFVTLKQAIAMGRRIRKGQRPCTRVVGWSKANPRHPDHPFTKSCPVFNLDQTEPLQISLEFLPARV